ncbi:MAG: metal-binding protein [Lachnospiraceae bacterium]|nr:metal-binding protein [Lachnospiraceae bacterium]
MDNSSRFFANKECEFYPCHKSVKDINCLFCYCPLYEHECPGNPKMTEKNGKIKKNCRDCLFPHIPENYDKVLSYLR